MAVAVDAEPTAETNAFIGYNYRQAVVDKQGVKTAKEVCLLFTKIGREPITPAERSSLGSIAKTLDTFHDNLLKNPNKRGLQEDKTNLQLAYMFLLEKYRYIDDFREQNLPAFIVDNWSLKINDQ